MLYQARTDELSLFIQDGNVAEKFEIRELNKLLIRELA
jgi:hypothetical protein